MPGKPGKSRMAGERNYTFVVVFLVMCGLLTVAAIKTMRQAYDYRARRATAPTACPTLSDISI